jgi:2-keto-4-pentenoate hydratase
MMGSDDARIRQGLLAQRALLERLLAEGAGHIGWKTGFGSPATLTLLATTEPLIGFLTDRTLLTPDAGTAAPVALDGWVRPMAEAEIAVIMGEDLPPDAGPEQALAAVGAVAPAIELADVTFPPAADAVTEILAGDIYHRHVLIGERRPTPSGWRAADLSATVHYHPADGGPVVTDVADVEVAPGPAVAGLLACARAAATLGPGLRRGDVVIMGSIVPLVPIERGERFEVRLLDLPPIAVRTDA